MSRSTHRGRRKHTPLQLEASALTDNTSTNAEPQKAALKGPCFYRKLGMGATLRATVISLQETIGSRADDRFQFHALPPDDLYLPVVDENYLSKSPSQSRALKALGGQALMERLSSVVTPGELTGHTLDPSISFNRVTNLAYVRLQLKCHGARADRIAICTTLQDITGSTYSHPAALDVPIGTLVQPKPGGYDHILPIVHTAFRQLELEDRAITLGEPLPVTGLIQP